MIVNFCVSYRTRHAGHSRDNLPAWREFPSHVRTGERTGRRVLRATRHAFRRAARRTHAVFLVLRFTVEKEKRRREYTHVCVRACESRAKMARISRVGRNLEFGYCDSLGSTRVRAIYHHRSILSDSISFPVTSTTVRNCIAVSARSRSRKRRFPRGNITRTEKPRRAHRAKRLEAGRRGGGSTGEVDRGPDGARYVIHPRKHMGPIVYP